MAVRQKEFPNVTAQEAHAALRWLHATGKVSTAQIRGALAKREALARQIRAELERLGDAGGALLQEVGRLERRGRPRKPRPMATAAQQAAWRVQGQYLGAVRRLSKAHRAKVKAIREKNGVRLAIAAAKRLGR